MLVYFRLAWRNVWRHSRRTLITSREGAFSVAITGQEPEQELPVSLAEQHVVAGRNLSASDADLLFSGKGLADAMGVAVGDRVTPVGRGTHQQMRQSTMPIAGIVTLCDGLIVENNALTNAAASESQAAPESLAMSESVEA